MHVLHMNNGEGETSYANNSLLQKKVISGATSMVDAAIVKILSDVQPESMGFAELGCASGPNSLIVVSQIIHTVDATCHQLGRPVPELKISLNDLPGNDFNNVFKLLPEFYRKLKADYSIEACYVWGMPGSFYGRLFPDESLHFVHSSSSLHWLSQEPVGLRPYLNKEKIYISKSSSTSVVEAYQLQFQKDFSVFLRSRAKEIIIKGRMVLSFTCRMSSDHFSDEACFQWEHIGSALMSLASDGLIEKEMIDSFNVPYYAPSLEEVELEVEKEGSFIVDGVDTFEIDWDDSGDSSKLTKESSGDRVAKTMRGGIEPMLGSHFHLRPEIMDELFRRYAIIIDNVFAERRLQLTTMVISLVKKG